MAERMPDFSGVQSGKSTTANVKYVVTAPDGHEIELEGPDGASEEDIAYVASQLYTPPEPKPRDERGAAGVGLSQLAQSAKGALLGPFKGAWALGEGAGEVAGHGLMGDMMGGVKRGAQLVSDVYHSVADPFEHLGQMTGELVAPGSQPTDVLDPNRLASTAEGMGGQASGLAMQARAPKLVSQAPEHFMQKAANLEQKAAARPDANISSAPGVVAAATRGARKIAGKVSDARIPLYKKAAEVIARNQSNPYGETQAPAQDPFSVEAMRQQTFEPLPETPAIEKGFGGQTRNMRPAQSPDSPFASDYITEEAYRAQQQSPEQVAPSVEQPAPAPRQPSVMDLDNQRWLQEQHDMPAQQPITPMDVQQLQQAINPAGAGPQTWLVRNAERVLDYAPELRGLPPGEQFIRKAIDAYNRADMDLHAAELSVPPETMVPRSQLQKDLLAIQADYAARNLITEVNQVGKVLSGLDQFPAGEAIPWQDFLRLKSGVWKDSSAAVRRARGAFIKAAGEVAPQVNEAAQNYSLMRRVLEGAKIDPLTRRPLKPIKP